MNLISVFKCALLTGLLVPAGCQNENGRGVPKGDEAVWQGNAGGMFSRQDIIVKTEAGKTFHFPVKIVGNSITSELGPFGLYTEELVVKDNTTTLGKVSLKIAGDEGFIVQCPFAMPKPRGKPYFMIPGFLYGSNNLKGSDGKQPKFDYGGKVSYPNSSLWYIRADRSTHPGVITVANNRVSMVGIGHRMIGHEQEPADVWSPRYVFNGVMLDSSDPAEDRVGFQLGYENAPGRYSWTWNDSRIPRENAYRFGWIRNAKGKTLTTQTFYFTDRASSVKAYGKAIEAYYHAFHQPPLKRSQRLEALEKIGTFSATEGYNQDNKFFFLYDGPGGNMVGDIAWTGGMQVAYPLLAAGMRVNNPLFIARATDFIDNLSTQVMNPKAGLLNEEFRAEKGGAGASTGSGSVRGKWNVTGWWGIGVNANCFDMGDHPLHSAYLNGQAAYYLLKAYERNGCKKERWLKTAQTVLDTVLKSQNTAGAYGVFFDPETGKAVDYDGFQSCWFLPGMALLARLTQAPQYRESATKAARYYDSLYATGELFNTPMDTHKAVDQEGNLSFIVATAELHKLTHDRVYLDMARDALDWEFSWKFCYNKAYSHDPLRRLNWSTCGGSITSTHNCTIHQMGTLVAGDIHYLYTQVKDPYIASRLKDTCVWGLGTYNRVDNDFGFGKVGHATEQFTYTDGLVLAKRSFWDGGVWEVNLTWASACVLNCVADDIPDEFFGE
jgi:hypothetical protein